MRYKFNLFDQTRGGMSESAAKVEAARKNGERGGRPSYRSLIERVLNRRVEREPSIEVLPWDNPQANWPQIRDNIISRVAPQDRRIITSYFECDDWMDIPPMISWKHLPSQVRRVLRHIRAGAKIYFSKPVKIRRPKNYVVVRVDKGPEYESEESFKRRYPDMPWCPTVSRRVHLSKLENWWWFDMKYKSGVRLTEAEILYNGDHKLTQEQAHAIWLWLNYVYRRNKSPETASKPRRKPRLTKDSFSRLLEKSRPANFTEEEWEKFLDERT